MNYFCKIFFLVLFTLIGCTKEESEKPVPPIPEISLVSAEFVEAVDNNKQLVISFMITDGDRNFGLDPLTAAEHPPYPFHFYDAIKRSDGSKVPSAEIEAGTVNLEELVQWKEIEYPPFDLWFTPFQVTKYLARKILQHGKNSINHRCLFRNRS